MTETRKVADYLAQARANAEKGRMGQAKFVHDWKSRIPSWSRWSPGMPGDPSCEHCKGIGYVRFDLPVGHKDQGKLFECECVAVMRARMVTR